MSNKAFAITALLAVAGSIAMPAAATGAPVERDTRAIVDFCKELVDSGDVPWLSTGECVALNLSSDAELHNFWVHRCDNWRDEGVLDLLGYSSFSECVRNR